MRGIFRTIAATTACLTALAATAASAEAASSGGAEWSSARLPGLAGSLFLLNVSCPSKALCVATGTQNLIASSTNPTGGAGAWRVVYAGEGFYESPSGPVITNRQVQGVSCPTTRLCVAVTTLGQIYSTTDPTGPASSWKIAEVPSEGGNTHLYGVSCPSASLCVAVSGRRVNRGKVFTSTDPTGGPDAWQITDLGESFDFRAVSCSSPTLCVAAGANGELVASTNPTGGQSAWSSLGTPDGAKLMQTISCTSGLCLTGNSAGDLLTSTSPLQPSSWQTRSGGGSVQISGASCPSSSACIAVDVNGRLHVSTAPSGGSSAWTSATLVPYSPESEEFNPKNPNGLFGASCPSPSFCAAVGSGGQILTSTNPFAEPSNSGGTRRHVHEPRRPKITIAKLILPSARELREHRGHGIARFYANGPIRRAECMIGHRPLRHHPTHLEPPHFQRRHARGRHFHPCHSPTRFRVGIGIYALRVRAVGVTGLRGPVALKRFWAGERCIRNSCLNGAGELPPKKRR